MNLSTIMNNSIVNISAIAKRFYIKNRKGRQFMRGFISAAKDSALKRNESFASGINIPPFLIASIASECNLFCKGCYARAGGSCGEKKSDSQLSAVDWKNVFVQSADAGVSFILIAGGEPLLRRDVLENAAGFKNIIFPIFTNGTLIDESYISLFDNNRNLIPVLSVEGDNMQTDARRGEGISQKLERAAAELKNRGIMFGASITITKENKNIVINEKYIKTLKDSGCGIVFFVEYVPVEKGTEYLVLNESDLTEIQNVLAAIREERKNKNIILLSFPGDEELLGGCLAAGRGFFHINPSGGAEPCPFSPYSQMNVKNNTIIEIVTSPFFEKIRQISLSNAINHSGGCTLFQYEQEVKKILN